MLDMDIFCVLALSWVQAISCIDFTQIMSEFYHYQL